MAGDGRRRDGLLVGVVVTLEVVVSGARGARDAVSCLAGLWAAAFGLPTPISRA
eukprot:COSAG01_NODE_10541_length_2135_cov_238.133104_2_plen_54_part_00